MQPQASGPEVDPTLKPLEQWKLKAERIERAATGKLAYQPGDPDYDQRPFTPEYDEPVQQLDGAEQLELDEPEDTTPSADARDLYRMPSEARLRETRKNLARQKLAPMRLAIAEAMRKTAEQKNPYTNIRPPLG